MARMSARFVAQQIGMSVKCVYEIWNDMGLVIKDKFGDWALTDLGRQNGGRMSQGNRLPVPTFELETIEKMMIDFLNHHKKSN